MNTPTAWLDTSTVAGQDDKKKKQAPPPGPTTLPVGEGDILYETVDVPQPTGKPKPSGK